MKNFGVQKKIDTIFAAGSEGAEPPENFEQIRRPNSNFSNTKLKVTKSNNIMNKCHNK